MKKLMRSIWFRMFFRQELLVSDDEMRKHDLPLIVFRWTTDGRLPFLRTRSERVSVVLKGLVDAGSVAAFRTKNPEYTLDEIRQVLVFGRIYGEAKRRLHTEIAAGRRKPTLHSFWHWVGWIMRALKI